MTDWVRIPCVIQWEGEPEPDLSGLVDPVRIPILRVERVPRRRPAPVPVERIGYAPRNLDSAAVPPSDWRPSAMERVSPELSGGPNIEHRDADERSPLVHLAAAIEVPFVPDGDPRIDYASHRLQDLLAEAVDHVGPGKGPVYGTLVHSEFTKLVRAAGIPGIASIDVEPSFLDGFPADYGTKGSIRPDVVLHDDKGKIIAVYDVKTGSAVLTNSRRTELRRAMNIPGDVRIFELRVLSDGPIP